MRRFRCELLQCEDPLPQGLQGQHVREQMAAGLVHPAAHAGGPHGDKGKSTETQERAWPAIARGERFAGTKTVILDEIHASAASKRGTYMMTAVERLVLMSATVRPQQCLLARPGILDY